MEGSSIRAVITSPLLTEEISPLAFAPGVAVVLERNASKRAEMSSRLASGSPKSSIARKPSCCGQRVEVVVVGGGEARLVCLTVNKATRCLGSGCEQGREVRGSCCEQKGDASGSCCGQRAGVNLAVNRGMCGCC